MTPRLRPSLLYICFYLLKKPKRYVTGSHVLYEFYLQFSLSICVPAPQKENPVSKGYLAQPGPGSGFWRWLFPCFFYFLISRNSIH